MGPQDVKVTKLAQVNGADSTGKAETQIQVTYMVGSHGPFTHNFSQAGFEASQVTQRLEAFARQVGQLPGV